MVYHVTSVLYLPSVLHVILFCPWNMFCTFYISTSHSMCAVPNMAVFCSSLITCFPGMLLRYCLSDFEMVPVAHIITGITFAVTFHMRWISIMKSLYFKIFSTSFLITYCHQWGELDVDPYWHHYNVSLLNHLKPTGYVMHQQV